MIREAMRATRVRFLTTSALILTAYIGTYLGLSRVAFHEAITADDDHLIWAFEGVRQRFDKYADTDSLLISKEIRLRWVFFPLVTVDRWFGHVHALDDRLPETGG